MNLGELEILTRYPGWQYFGTLTWARNPNRHFARALGGAVQFFGRTAQLVEVRFSQLVWCLRAEREERFDRGHHHYLLGGIHKFPANQSGASTLRWLWESAGLGFSDVKVFDQSRRGPAYVLDCLSGSATRGGANYEARKFAFVEQPPMLSESLLRWHRRFEREFLASEKRKRRWLYRLNEAIRHGGMHDSSRGTGGEVPTAEVEVVNLDRHRAEREV